jgi:hypothetical protein
METLYLSRRNLLALLSKLDRVKDGGQSACAIVKNDTTHPVYPQSCQIYIQAVEDEDYYIDRAAGLIHPEDEPK